MSAVPELSLLPGELFSPDPHGSDAPEDGTDVRMDRCTIYVSRSFGSPDRKQDGYEFEGERRIREVEYHERLRACVCACVVVVVVVLDCFLRFRWVPLVRSLSLCVCVCTCVSFSLYLSYLNEADSCNYFRTSVPLAPGLLSERSTFSDAVCA